MPANFFFISYDGPADVVYEWSINCISYVSEVVSMDIVLHVYVHVGNVAIDVVNVVVVIVVADVFVSHLQQSGSHLEKRTVIAPVFRRWQCSLIRWCLSGG